MSKKVSGWPLIAPTEVDTSILPVIGEGDAGKVLSVNAGETGVEWAEPSGGGSDFLAVNLEISMTSLSAFSVTSCDKTGAEINAAAAAGTPIIAYLTVAGYGMKYTLVDPYISFTTAATDPAGVHGFIFQRDVTADTAIQLYIMEFEVANADPGSNPWGSGTLKNVKIAYT